MDFDWRLMHMCTVPNHSFHHLSPHHSLNASRFRPIPAGRHRPTRLALYPQLQSGKSNRCERQVSGEISKSTCILLHLMV